MAGWASSAGAYLRGRRPRWSVPGILLSTAVYRARFGVSLQTDAAMPAVASAGCHRSIQSVLRGLHPHPRSGDAARLEVQRRPDSPVWNGHWGGFKNAVQRDNVGHFTRHDGRNVEAVRKKLFAVFVERWAR